MNKELQKFAEEFWDELARQKNQEKMLDYIYDRIDKCLKANRFDVVDAILLVGIPYVNFVPPVKLALLTRTKAAKDKLQNRSDFYEACKSRFLSREETKDRTEDMLMGLE